MITLLVLQVASATPAAATSPPAFAICRACHATQANAPPRVGPNLAGVVDRKAGSVPKFAYSAAMTKSGLVWNEAALDAFLANPQKTVPGTRMAYGGTRNPGDRAAIISYLASLP